MRKLLQTVPPIVLLLMVATRGFCYENRNILQAEAEKIGLDSALVQDFSSLGFPTYNDRNFWDSLNAELRKQYIVAAEKQLKFAWSTVKATDYLEFKRTGDRRQSVFSRPRHALVDLVMGELVEGKGRFLDQIVNGVWYYSEQSWWGWSAHLSSSDNLPDTHAPFIDLGVGDIANVLSWTWYLFKAEFDKVHPFIAQRLKEAIQNKVLNHYYARDDYWWQGFKNKRANNWNTWINYNLLNAILIIEDNPQQKIDGIRKLLRSLDVFINTYPDDGGCDEGPSYWHRAGGTLFECLELLGKVTKGQFNVFEHPLVKNIGTYIYKAYINYPYVVNFADADPVMNSVPHMIFRYGQAIGDSAMQNFGAFSAMQQHWGATRFSGTVDEQIIQLMTLKEVIESPAENLLLRDFWLPDTEIAGARDTENSPEGFFFAAKGGNNGENHNHNDVGNFILYYDGNPCLIDLGRGKYTAKTFSKARYTIMNMQSQYHNLPTINGAVQMPGKQFRAADTAFMVDEQSATFSTDISGAYSPEAQVSRWVRSYRLQRGNRFTITDAYEFKKRTKKKTTLSYITYCTATKFSRGKLVLIGEGFRLLMQFNPQRATVKVEKVKLTDTTLKRFWPNGVNRIIFQLHTPQKNGKNEIHISPMKQTSSYNEQT